MNSVKDVRRGGLVNLFGDLRIKASWQLPVAYRSRVRPSSVLSSKASTVCINVEYFLAFVQFVHIWPSIYHKSHRSVDFSVFTFQSANGVFPCGPERARTAYLLIANEMFYQLNYGPGSDPVFNLQYSLKIENFKL